MVSTLKGIAERSQGNLRALVTDGELRDRVSDIRVLWGVNGVALEAAADAIARLAELPEVGWVLYDRAPARAEGAGGRMRPPERAFGDDRLWGPNPNATVAPDVVAHGAKQVWDELGYTGLGVTVAVIDTGFDRTHPRPL